MCRGTHSRGRINEREINSMLQSLELGATIVVAFGLIFGVA